MIRLLTALRNSSFTIKLALLALVLAWTLALMAVIVALVLVWERPSRAQPPEPGVSLIPEISLEPVSGSIGTPINVRGEGWNANQTVLIYLSVANESTVPDYAISSALVDQNGRFLTSFVIPADSRWENQEQLRVIARTMEGETAAQAFFRLLSLVSQPTQTPTTPAEEPSPEVPSPTPTSVVELPASTPIAVSPLVSATADVNIRSGPGTVYPILGLLRTGQNAEVTGVNADWSWWQIKFAGAANERGWISARYASSQNTENVLVVQAPPPPVQSIPTPVTITDWRGEYYNNPDLSGSPVLVRNDSAINFDWGTAAPAAEIGSDSFSVRWTRNLNFPAGNYRFYVRVDDGVRLWIDDRLVVDRWHESSPTTYTADVTLNDGTHRFRLEYFERTGSAVAQLTWELVETYPDWKGEYFNNPGLNGPPALVRNDLNLSFGWGPNSPGPGVPADNFSVRWTRSAYFGAGTYRFKVLVDDGARLWVDDNLIIDRWRAGDPQTFTAEVNLSEGMHRLRLEYFEYRYDAQVRLDWERGGSYPDWKAEYFDNRKLQGNPVVVRNEKRIEHDWGRGSPASGIPADNFSARWTRKVDFPAGTYQFKVKVDDGVRVWIDDTLIIDSWQDGSTRTLEGERQVSEGQHRLKVEYYERGGEARLEIRWQKKEIPTNQLPQAVAGGPYTAEEGGTVTFDGRGSRDPDGSIVSYEWDFDYDGRTFTVDATGPTAMNRYPDGPAILTVALRVTDNRGASHVSASQVTVQNVAPTAEAGGPYAGQVDNLITLTGTATDAGLIDQTGLTYRWEYGDGSEGGGPVVGHSYTQSGIYTVKLTVTDKDGAQGSDTATVEVSMVDQPPLAVINGPEQGMVDETLTFDSSGSSGDIVSFTWDLGDGATHDGEVVTHSYSSAGNYVVTLTVTATNGATASATWPVEISEPVESSDTEQPAPALLKAEE